MTTKQKEMQVIHDALLYGLKEMQASYILPKVDYTNPIEMKLRKKLNLK